jgi:hypothetical protein
MFPSTTWWPRQIRANLQSDPSSLSILYFDHRKEQYRYGDSNPALRRLEAAFFRSGNGGRVRGRRAFWWPGVFGGGRVFRRTGDGGRIGDRRRFAFWTDWRWRGSIDGCRGGGSLLLVGRRGARWRRG